MSRSSSPAPRRAHRTHRLTLPALVSVALALGGCQADAPTEPTPFSPPLRPHANLSIDATFVVNAADDAADTDGCDGTHCSLREAITAANATAAADRIEFDIAGAGPHIIQPGTNLPPIVWPVVIDGYTQDGAAENTDAAGTNAVIEVVLDGSAAAVGTGLHLAHGESNGSDGSIVQGLAIGGFSEGIRVEAANIVIRGNFIGTDASGAALPNVAGITIGGSAALVGGTAPGDRNLISGNTQDGITLFNVATVQGNLIGVNAAGSAALPNDGNGVSVQTVQALVGGGVPGARNVISGNGLNGVYMFNSATTSLNVIEGNYIGTGAAGAAAIPNGLNGILIERGNESTIRGNVVSGHAPSVDPAGGAGVRLVAIGFSTPDRNVVAGNFIGTDATGAAALPNRIGVWFDDGTDNVLGGGDAADRNLISGNVEAGVLVGGGGNLVRGNYIGTDITGTSALPNGVGVLADEGIATIGGWDTGEGNVIAGNDGAGIHVTDGDGGDIHGNLIGLAAGGTAALPNGHGIVVESDARNVNVGGDPDFTGPDVGNVISGNAGAGILLRASDNFVQSNLIGLAADGTTPLGNGGPGIRIEGGGTNEAQIPSSNGIGGFVSSGNLITRTANVIAHNGGPGVIVAGTGTDAPHTNAIRANVIRDNGGLGIDLSESGSGDEDGVTPNDADGTDEDVGPNLLQNFPVLASAIAGPSATTVAGTVPGDFPGGLTIELFSSPTCDPSGHGEGAVFLGYGFSDDDGSHTSQVFELVVDASTPGHFLTATATDQFGNTSEFSACLEIENENRPPTIDMGGPYSGDEGSPIALSIDFDDPDGNDGVYIFSFDAGNGESWNLSDVPTDHVYADDGSYTYSFTVDDKDNPPVTGQVTIDVANVAPTVEISSLPGGADEGETVEVQFTFTDPGLLDAPWSYTVDWGDGNSTASTETSTHGDDLSATHAYAAAGTYTVVVTVADKDGGEGTASQETTILEVVGNGAPEIDDTGGPYNGLEGSPIGFSATASDPDDDPLTFEWDFDGDDVADATTANASFSFPEDGTYTVKLTVSDGALSTTQTLDVTVANVAPTLEAITAPVDPQPVNGTIEISAEYSDPGTEDTHTATIDWGDGSVPEVVPAGGGLAEGSHSYAEAGVYRITMTVEDDDGGVSNEQVFEYVVVYDPSAGFVTGGGWIDSPEGAYAADPTLTGKATFGFVSRYKKGAHTPTGDTEFRFQAAGFTFESTSYQWLVVGGPKAQFKGEGTINGAGTFKFLLTATDGQAKGGGGEDMFRIKVTDLDDNVIYDNVPGGSDQLDEANPQAIAKGSIVIHGK